MKQPERDSPGLLVQALALAVALVALFSRRPLRRPPRGVDAEDLAAGYERSDLSPTVVIGALAGLGVVLVVLLVFVTALGTAVTGVPVTVGDVRQVPVPTPPAPRLEVQPGQSLAPYLAAEQQRLTTYRWVDRPAGIASMPIERAMDVLASEGLPVAPGDANTGTTAPSRASSGRVDEAYP